MENIFPSIFPYAFEITIVQQDSRMSVYFSVRKCEGANENNKIQVDFVEIWNKKLSSRLCVEDTQLLNQFQRQ